MALGMGGRSRVNNAQTPRLAALAGVGIIGQANVTATGDLAEGRLVFPDRRPPPKLRGFVESIAGRLGATPRRSRKPHDFASPGDQPVRHGGEG